MYNTNQVNELKFQQGYYPKYTSTVLQFSITNIYETSFMIVKVLKNTTPIR